MTVIKTNPDVGLRPLLRFSQQFLNTDPSNTAYILKENIEKLVRVFTGELQELEEAIVDLMYNLAVFDFLDEDGNIFVEKAFGKSLDVIAKVVGAEPRQGMSDDQYRAEIALQIAINTSKGNIVDVTEALKKITQATIVEWTDNFPAGIDFTTNGDYAGAEVISQITQILSAGVGFSLTYKNEDIGVFEFSDRVYDSDVRLYCSVTNGSANVTLAQPTRLLKAGVIVLFESTGATQFTVSSVSGTSVVLTGNFSGSTNNFTYMTVKDGGILYSPDYNTYKAWSDLYSTFANPVSVTNGSDTVTINAADNTKAFAGDRIFFDEESGNEYIIDSIAGTSIVLTTDYDGTTNATATAYISRVNKTLTGTVQVTNGSASVVYNDTTDNPKVMSGDAIFFGGSQTGYQVDTTSGTGFTMTAVYTGSTNAAISCAVRPRSGALVDIFF